MPEGIRGQPLRLSRFHCREMLYDYMSGNLDPERLQAVEAGLIEFPELKKELEALKSAAHYCAELGKIKPQVALVQSFQQIRLKSEIVAEKVKYKNWPDLLRWSSEAIVISVFVAAIGWAIPWSAIQNVFKIESSPDVVLADIGSKAVEDVQVPPLPAESKTTAPEPAAPIKAEPPKPEPAKPAPLASTPPPAKAVAKTANSALVEKKKGPQGFLYRILMNVAGIQNSAPALAEQIISMGGEKAGQVEIGHRQATGNYFHFSIPEANYQRLLKTLGAYGPVRIYKGPHQRVMPDGVIRIILNIEDAKGSAPAASKKSNATGTTTEANENTDSAATPSESTTTIESSPSDDTTSAGE